MFYSPVSLQGREETKVSPRKSVSFLGLGRVAWVTSSVGKWLASLPLERHLLKLPFVMSSKKNLVLKGDWPCNTHHK